MRISVWSSDVCSSDLRLAQDGHAGAVPIVDEHQRIGTPASELGELRAVGGLAVLVCGEAGDLAALGLELAAEGIGETLAVVVVQIGHRHLLGTVGQQLAGQDRKSTRLNSSH